MAFGQRLMIESKRIPNDPLSMPPPYWQDCEALDQLIRALQTFRPLLAGLSNEINRIDPLLQEYMDCVEAFGDAHDADGRLFDEIHAEYIQLVCALGSYADLATLMAAITAESLINKFCVYNLHQDIAAPLEKLTPPEKLVVACAILGFPGTKSLAPHGAATRLHKWRNAYAHGHCVTTNRKGLLRNHLRSSPVGAGEREAPQITRSLLTMVCGFVQICDFLGEMTRNDYVLKDEQVDIRLVSQLCRGISAFRFSSDDYPYEIEEPSTLLGALS